MLGLVLAACAGQAAEWRTVAPAGAGWSASMPERRQERRVREGTAKAHIVWGVDEHDGAYEVARFELPEVLEAEAKAVLMKTIVGGIAGAAGRHLVEARAIEVGGRRTLELIVDLPEGRRGTWWILWADDRTMLQVSAMGPRGEPLDTNTRRFLSSLTLAR